MSVNAKIVIVDDHQMHRSMIGMNLAHAQKKLGDCEFTIIAELEDGQQLIDQVQTLQPDLITLDIRMPLMDGLTALLHLRKRLHWNKPIVMVSSESNQTMDLHHQLQGSDSVDHMSEQEKLGHMAKVEERVMTGQHVDGKINSLLEGCERLKLDPGHYALALGANGFLHKPYKLDEFVAIIPEVLNGKTYQPT